MSRVAKNPVSLPKGVEIKLDNDAIQVKGPKGTLEQKLPPFVIAEMEDGSIQFKAQEGAVQGRMMAGTARSLVNNMVKGVSEGFEKKLTLIGVGYRAQAQGKTVNLTLGFSHPVNYELPEGITAETPSQTEIVIRGIDKQRVGQVAADIRAYRPPEPYKGKGVKYAGEHIVRKEAKKK